jgi:hypothetical protein
MGKEIPNFIKPTHQWFEEQRKAQEFFKQPPRKGNIMWPASDSAPTPVKVIESQIGVTGQQPQMPSVSPAPTPGLTDAGTGAADAASKFQTAFADGATTIASAGKDAGSAIASGLQNGAAAAGATIAAAISGAKVNVNVNVTGAGASGGKGDPGASPQTG